MPDAPRITIDDLLKRMAAHQQFTFIDTRNPNAWAESDVKIPGALRFPADKLEENLPIILKDRPVVAYCT